MNEATLAVMHAPYGARVVYETRTESGIGELALVWFGVEEVIDIRRSDGTIKHLYPGLGETARLVDARGWLATHPEFVTEWDVYRDDAGIAPTVDCGYGHYEGPPLSKGQLKAVRRAVDVWRLVCAAEGSDQTDRTLKEDGTLDWRAPNVAKSRLLWRMIHEGLPPTRTRPPLETAGPAWWLLPGGDPFPRAER